jgi:UDP-N-acetylglucosamine acyltransferase
VRIGRLAMLGGASVVSKDVPPFFTARPMAVNTILGVNVVGLRRAGMTQAERDEVKNAFGILYRSGLNVHQALAEIRKTFDDGPALEICAFAEQSKRGICGMGGTREEE